MKPEWVNIILEMRAAGFAIAVFAPEELRGVSADTVENEMVSSAAECIEFELSDSEEE